MDRRTFIAGAGAAAVYGCQQPSEQLGQVSFGVCAPEDDPGTIFGGLGPSFAQWLRGTDVIHSSGNVSQLRDLSGSSRHEVYAGPTSPAQYVASDVGFNGQPVWQNTGGQDSYCFVSNWARLAPGTKPVWVRLVMRQDSSAANKVIIGDATANAFVIRQDNNLGKLVMRNGSSANSNATAAIGDVCVVEAYFSNHVSFDYLRVRSIAANGQNAGNNAGTEEWMAAAPGAISRGVYTCADKVVVLGPIPTLDMLARDSAYCVNRYGMGVV